MGLWRLLVVAGAVSYMYRGVKRRKRTGVERWLASFPRARDDVRGLCAMGRAWVGTKRAFDGTGTSTLEEGRSDCGGKEWGAGRTEQAGHCALIDVSNPDRIVPSKINGLGVKKQNRALLPRLLIEGNLERCPESTLPFAASFHHHHHPLSLYLFFPSAPLLKNLGQERKRKSVASLASRDRGATPRGAESEILPQS